MTIQSESISREEKNEETVKMRIILQLIASD